LDIDLAILGEKSDRYFKYSMDLREEYQDFSDQQWKCGRKIFLENMLKKNKIYFTKYFDDKYFNNVKNNLEAELKLLM
jgi:predicted metal-dependent HD superfamily phosphohydrolase